MSTHLIRTYLEIINENSYPTLLDEDYMNGIKSLVPKVMKLLGKDTAAKIAQQVKQATGGDFTTNKENAVKVAKALGFEKILRDKVGDENQEQLAEAWGLAGNWQGKLIQLLYAAIPSAGIATMAGFGPGPNSFVGQWLMAVGVLLLSFADTFFSTNRGMVGAMGRYGNKGTENDKGPNNLY